MFSKKILKFGDYNRDNDLTGQCAECLIALLDINLPSMFRLPLAGGLFMKLPLQTSICYNIIIIINNNYYYISSLLPIRSNDGTFFRQCEG